MIEHDPENYYNNGWVKIPSELMNDEYEALSWLSDFDLCIYPGLNSRQFHITDLDHSLTIMYHKQQPRRFPVTELYFK